MVILWENIIITLIAGIVGLAIVILGAIGLVRLISKK